MIDNLTMSGRLTRDPEVKATGASGRMLCKFGLACERYMGKDDAGKAKTRTVFIDVVVWGALGEAIGRCFSKGDPIELVGWLDFRQWDGPDGGKRSKHEFVAEWFGFPITASASPTDGAPF